MEIHETTRDEWSWCLDHARPRRLRTLRQFAEAEIVVPEGPYQHERFRVSRQPYTGLLYDALDSGLWRRAAVVGCVQSGKTFAAFLVVLAWLLFELRETVICGVPQMDTAGDKWREEIRPVIEPTRYRRLLPTGGKGSRGGTPEAIKFANGATLKFMSGKGRDEKRSAFTARNLVATEADKYDTAGVTSREADPITQMEARTRAYDDRARIILECTPSISTGRIWTEYTEGTASRIVVRCPPCKAWTTPEREHLVGWQDAKNIDEAGRLARWLCPGCAATWTDRQRREMNRDARLIHKGQKIDARGQVRGDEPATDTLGFRWNAFNNMFWTAATVGQAEWSAARRDDEDEAEKEMLQFFWARPWEPPEVELNPLSAQQIRRRTGRLPRGQVPDDAIAISAGVDLGKWLAHYVVIAWLANERAAIVDYGILEIDTDRLGELKATGLALREFRDLVLAGYPLRSGGTMAADQVWIDSAYPGTRLAVYEFCRDSGSRGRFYPAKGYGQMQQRDRSYRRPGKKTAEIRVIGDEYHFARQREARVDLVHVNADHWKSRTHEAYRLAADAAGSLQLFAAPENEHRRYAKHMTAEVQKEIDVPGKGPVIVWERKSRNNHWFDATYLAVAAGHRAAELLVKAGRSAARAGDWFAGRKTTKRPRRAR